MNSLSPATGAQRQTAYPHSAPAKLRLLSGLSKVAFARRCGIPYNTYKSIEIRTNDPNPANRNISRYHAALLAIATGASAEGLLQNRLQVYSSGTEYTKEDYKAHDKLLSSSSGWQNRCWRGLMLRANDFVVEASGKSGIEALVMFVAFAISLDDVERRFNALEASEKDRVKPFAIEELLDRIATVPDNKERHSERRLDALLEMMQKAEEEDRPSRRGSRGSSK